MVRKILWIVLFFPNITISIKYESTYLLLIKGDACDLFLFGNNGCFVLLWRNAHHNSLTELVPLRDDERISGRRIVRSWKHFSRPRMSINCTLTGWWVLIHPLGDASHRVLLGDNERSLSLRDRTRSNQEDFLVLEHYNGHHTCRKSRCFGQYLHWRGYFIIRNW